MPEDLGLTNQAISDLFEHPNDPDQWLDLALNEAQLKQFKESGYLHGIKILNAEQIKTLENNSMKWLILITEGE